MKHRFGLLALASLFATPVPATAQHQQRSAAEVRQQRSGFNAGSVVYHDDFGDFSTDEPIMDGTANRIHLLSTRVGMAK